MMVGKYILSIDQGTTSSRAVLFDAFGGVAGMGQREFPQIYPQPGYVEHDAVQILQTTLYAMRQAVEQAGIRARDIAAISITNQRETTVAWDAVTGIPVCNAIVWQCRRTAPECERLRAAGMERYIKDTTGLLIDPYFSGTKMKWILENVPAARDLAKKGRLRFGTIDTWLVYSLTDGAAYVTDVTNASRTMLFDIHKLRWDDTLLQELGIPRGALPRVCESGEIVGMCSADVLGEEIPIAGIAGDQHAALFGQCCFAEGMAKNTYGTGCFLLMNTGSEAVESSNGLITSLAAGTDDRPDYVLEGSVFVGGAAVQWLRDELGLISSAAESEEVALRVPSSEGVYVVPAFTGLGAPYWDARARAAIVGLTRGSGRAHIVRATLEGIAYQVADIVRAMSLDAGVRIDGLRVDGGASANNFLMSFQSDILGCRVLRPAVVETTALGAAYLAGITAGVWPDAESLRANVGCEREFLPRIGEEERSRLLRGWHAAVRAARAERG